MSKKNKKSEKTSEPKTKKHEQKTEHKVEPKAEHKPAVKKDTLPLKNKLINGAILLIILTAFSLMAIFMAQKVLEPTNLGNILPANQTVAFATINVADLSTKTTLSEDYSLNPANLEKTVAGYLNQESFDLLKSWFGSQIAIALIADTNQSIEKIYFLEYQSRSEAEKFLNSLTVEDESLSRETYEGHTIYSYSLSQNFSACFISNYMVISQNAEILKLIIDSSKGSSSNLKSLSAYNTIADNLPYDATGIAFWNVELYPDLAASYLPIYDMIPEALIAPVMSIFNGFGAAIQANADGFYIQTYTSVDKELLADNSYFSLVKKYNADLATFIPSEPEMFFGGENLQGEIAKTVSVFQQFNESAAIIFEGILRGAIKDYFGDSIDVDDDVYPIFEDEYAISAYENEEGVKKYLILVGLGDSEEKQIHIDTLKQGFLTQQIYSEPYVKTYVLQDGSEGKEVVADLVEILNEQVVYGSNTIDMFYLSNGTSLAYMTVLNNTLAISTDLDLLKQSVDLMNGSGSESFEDTENMLALTSIIGSADEASVIDIGAMKDSEFWGIEFFSPFSSISSGKNFFDDGIATFHMLHY